jgi:hypothetical protein
VWAPAPEPLSAAAAAAGRAAGCTNLDLAPAIAGDVPRNHFPTGQSTAYPSQPPTAGNHALDPLPPTERILTTPPDEARAVHTLEHGSVILSYRAPGDPGGLPQPVIDALEPVATGNPATYVAPSIELPEGTALSLRAWNVAIDCPASITVAQARTLAHGFVDALACTRNAPEPNNGDGC